jgi:DNA (cytosine-5)-methyltransferase 1
MTVYGIDFFCGVGGTTKGFQNAGVKVVKGIDNDPTCQETYEKNCAPSKFIHGDIHNIKPADLMLDFRKSFGDQLIFIACAPCQPFSKSYNKEPQKDNRTNLILRFSEFVEEILPDVIFMENVPGLVKADSGRILKEFLNLLESDELGYHIEWEIIDAKDYGVPQTRKRFVMIASRLGKISFPVQTHGKNLLPFVTVRDTISKYPLIFAGESHKTIPNHSARNLSFLNLERIRCTPKDGGSRKDWQQNLWLDCHRKGNSGHSDVYGRMSWDKPAPTLTCRCNSISNGRFGHPAQNRAISLREAAALQTFSESFIFHGETTDIARHIGNAVPPLIAEIFGKIIAEFIQSVR